jgi:hypothetical protein
VIHWPQHADAPTAQENVTDEGSKVAVMVSKMKRATLDSSIIGSANGDMTPDTRFAGRSGDSSPGNPGLAGDTSR